MRQRNTMSLRDRSEERVAFLGKKTAVSAAIQPEQQIQLTTPVHSALKKPQKSKNVSNEKSESGTPSKFDSNRSRVAHSSLFSIISPASWTIRIRRWINLIRSLSQFTHQFYSNICSILVLLKPLNRWGEWQSLITEDLSLSVIKESSHASSNLKRTAILRGVLLIAVVVARVLLSYPINWYMSALNEKEEQSFYRAIGIFLGSAFLAVPVFALEQFTGFRLMAELRHALNVSLFRVYLTDSDFYHLTSADNNTASVINQRGSDIHNDNDNTNDIMDQRIYPDPSQGSLSTMSNYLKKTSVIVDNPGQRFGQDIASFSAGLLSLMTQIIKQLLTLCGFAMVLYANGTSEMILGLTLYSFLCTVVAMFIFSGRLSELSSQLLRLQATFTASIVRVNDWSETLALNNAAEFAFIHLCLELSALIKTSIKKAQWEAYFTIYNEALSYVSSVLPFLFLCGLYFNNQLTLGQLSQSSYAFNTLLRALTLLLDNTASITALSATAQRIVDAMQTIRDSRMRSMRINRILVDECDYDNNNDNDNDKDNQQTSDDLSTSSKVILKCEDLTYLAPKSTTILMDSLNMNLKSGESCLIMGPSGCGKSSLMRVIASLWTRGSGTIRRCSFDECCMIPQKPFVPSLAVEENTLRKQLLFPKREEHLINDDQLMDVLKKVNLDHLHTYSSSNQMMNGDSSILDCTADWASTLSMGEQQRLAIARVICANMIRPCQLIFADECTSALDADNEDGVYQVLTDMVKDKGMILLSIGHHQRLVRFHKYLLGFTGEKGQWTLTEN